MPSSLAHLLCLILIVIWRGSEPSHVPALLYLLYGATTPSTTPRNDFIPSKTERNQAIVERYCKGERASTLAREYQISEQRVYFILRRERRGQEPEM